VFVAAHPSRSTGARMEPHRKCFVELNRLSTEWDFDLSAISAPFVPTSPELSA
jgi:hypothetical protein